jgi:hypothetical protein
MDYVINIISIVKSSIQQVVYTAIDSQKQSQGQTIMKAKLLHFEMKLKFPGIFMAKCTGGHCHGVGTQAFNGDCDWMAIRL